MDAMGMMRDLDQIRERDSDRESTKLVLIALGGLTAACVLFTVGVFIGREGNREQTARREDPLARLDALAGQVAAQSPPAVTYPDRLIDPPAARTTAPPAPSTASDGTVTSATAQTARVAVPASAMLEPTGHVQEVPPAAAQLPVAPVNHHRIALAPANHATVTPAPPGSDGPFTLQVSSFRTLASAQTFAQRLRERGHRAFVTTGPATNNGSVWHRVRIGPFTTLREAQRYRAEFELRERIPTFVVRREEAGQR